MKMGVAYLLWILKVLLKRVSKSTPKITSSGAVQIVYVRGEINQRMGMDPKCINTCMAVIAGDFLAKDGAKKPTTKLLLFFPAPVNEDVYSNLEIDTKSKNEQVGNCESRHENGEKDL